MKSVSLTNKKPMIVTSTFSYISKHQQIKEMSSFHVNKEFISLHKDETLRIRQHYFPINNLLYGLFSYNYDW